MRILRRSRDTPAPPSTAVSPPAFSCYAVEAKEGGRSARSLHLLVALLYPGLGALFIGDPIGGSLSLTVLLTGYLIILGASRVAYAWCARCRGWMWGVILGSGLLNLVLVTVILPGLPATAL